MNFPPAFRLNSNLCDFLCVSPRMRRSKKQFLIYSRSDLRVSSIVEFQEMSFKARGGIMKIIYLELLFLFSFPSSSHDHPTYELTNFYQELRISPKKFTHAPVTEILIISLLQKYLSSI